MGKIKHKNNTTLASSNETKGTNSFENNNSRLNIFISEIKVYESRYKEHKKVPVISREVLEMKDAEVQQKVENSTILAEIEETTGEEKEASEIETTPRTTIATTTTTPYDPVTFYRIPAPKPIKKEKCKFDSFMNKSEKRSNADSFN